MVDSIAFRVKMALWSLASSGWSLEQRLEWLKSLDNWLVANKDLILKTVAQEKRTSEHAILLNEYVPVRLLCQYYLRNAKKILGDENRSRPFSLNFGNKKVVIRKEPLGVVGVISPHNHPLSLPMGAVISALMAGNGVILKPSSDTPKTGDLIERMVKETLRQFGAASIFERLQGKFGDGIVKCRWVDKIHFTGSTEVGLEIARKNALVRLTPPTLELGGSNPAIVLEDADIKKTASVIVWARFASMSCNNIKRVFVVESVFEEFWKEMENQMGALQRRETPAVLDKEKENYQRFVMDCLENHLELYNSQVLYPEMRDYMVGYGWPGGPFGPQIIRVSRPTDNLLVLKEETFVPFLPVVKVENEAEAVKWANKTQYGLGASVFTKDKKRFEKIARQLQCGSVSCNDAMTEFAQAQVPFGGWKESGYGHSHGPEGLLEFVRLKAIISETWSAPKVQLYPWTPFKMKWLRKLADWIVKLS